MTSQKGTPEGRVFQVAPGVMGIDLYFLGRPHLIASYVLTGPDGRFALVDVGPESTLDQLEAGLQALGLDLRRLEAVLVTHIHLDHAGAAGALAGKAGCPVYVHESGAPHLAEPARLWSSAARLFGADMQRLWKGISPVPAGQLRALGSRATVEVAGHTLTAYHTPGHASHHVVYALEGAAAVDRSAAPDTGGAPDGGVLFAGDAAGVRMPGSPYVWPPTPPPDLSLEQWDETIGLLRRLSPSLVAVGHFGAHREDVSDHLERLQRRLHRWAELVRSTLEEGLEEPQIIRRLQALAASELQALRADPGGLASYEAVSPMEHNAMGLLRYWQKRGATSTGGAGAPPPAGGTAAWPRPTGGP